MDVAQALEHERRKTTGAFGCLDESTSEEEDEEEEEDGSGAPPAPAPPAPPAKEHNDDAEAARAHSLRSRACVFVADEASNAVVLARVAPFLPQTLEDCCDARGKHRGAGALAGLNRRWRFYKYDAGGTYRPHVDGAWPGSGLQGTPERPEYVYDAFKDRLSKLTMLVYLNDDFEGGETAFFDARDDGKLAVVAVKPRRGAVLFFPHGETTGSLIHEGSQVAAGFKYVIRTEVLFTYPTKPDAAAAAPPPPKAKAPQPKGGRRRRR